MKFYLSLLLFAYSNLSFALGLGEIDLKSNLGEPLIASISVTDLESPLEAACFSITDISDISAFKKATVSLKQVNSNNLLTITTREVITEPIVNLRVSVQCDTQISREYLLLLDPITNTSTQNNLIADNRNVVINSIADSAQNKQPAVRKEASNNAQLAVPTLKKAKNRSSNRKVDVTQSASQKLEESYTGKQQTTNKAQATPALINKVKNQNDKPANTDKPFLIISGGSTSTTDNTATPSLSLRLETQLDLARVEPTATPLNVADTLDEVTVMTNRLAHLEKQLVSLQSRNTQLVAEVEEAKIAGSNWLQILLIGLGILLVLAAAEWSRRKIVEIRANKEATWFDAGSEAFVSDEDAAPNKRVENRFESDSLSESSGSEAMFNNSSIQSNSFANVSTYADHDKDDSESVIDHADVFIEHGRPTLAIQLLQNHLIDLPTESPAVWLKLIKLLAKDGTEAEYDDAVVECNKHFNIKVRSFADASLDDISSIEDHPDIVTRLEGVWGSQYAVGVLNDLIYNKRSQPREGFEHNTFEELFFLKQIAETLQPLNRGESDEDLSSLQPSFYQPDVTKPTLERVAFNQATFDDLTFESPNFEDPNIEDSALEGAIFEDRRASFESKPLTKTEKFSAAILSNKDNLNHLNPPQNELAAEFEAAKKLATLSLDSLPDSSYEVNMFFDVEDNQNTERKVTETNLNTLDLTEPLEMPPINETFHAEEIDFFIPTKSIDTENIAFDDTAQATESELFFDADFLNEEILFESDAGIEETSPKAKPKTKSKVTSPKVSSPKVTTHRGTTERTAKDESNIIEWDLPKLDKE